MATHEWMVRETLINWTKRHGYESRGLLMTNFDTRVAVQPARQPEQQDLDMHTMTRPKNTDLEIYIRYILTVVRDDLPVSFCR
jgi:hypothetical protein